MKVFTVAIPVLNGENYIKDALISIEAQTINGLHILISNNGSSDRTSEIINNWESRHSIEIIEREDTLPHLEHFNAILERIDTPKYMLLCHDDFFADSRALEKASSALDEFPDVNAVYCDLEYVSSDKKHLYTQKFNRHKLFEADEAGRRSLFFSRNMFGIPLAIRTSSLASFSYNLNLPYSGDIELSWLISRGQACLHLDQALICNRYRSDNMTWRLLEGAGAELVEIYEEFYGPASAFTKLRIILSSSLSGMLKNLFRIFVMARMSLGR